MDVWWQEVVTFLILGAVVWFLVKRYFFRKKPAREAGEGACGLCSSDSCSSCAVMYLKREIELKRVERDRGKDQTKKEPILKTRKATSQARDVV